MKKIFILFLLFCPIIVHAELVNYSKSGVLFEPSTHKVLYEYNKDEKLAPASMTKMMTLLIVMENIYNNEISLDDLVPISENAEHMGGSQVYLQANTSIKLSELIKAICIASANDAAVAVSEYIAGSAEDFVNLMNDKVVELDLKNTHFMNVHGLDEDNHYSSAYDMAVIASKLLEYPVILNYSSQYEDYLNKPDGTKMWLVNTNKLIRYYEGIDGLKTGYTSSALYCITATGKKNDTRMISVVMGSDTSEHRSNDTISLLNYGFNNYKVNTVINKDDYVTNSTVYKGSVSNVDVIALESLSDLVKLNEKKDYSYNYNIKKIVAPINKGDVIGSVEIVDDNNTKIGQVNLTVSNNIKKQNIVGFYFSFIKKIIRGF